MSDEVTVPTQVQDIRVTFSEKLDSIAGTTRAFYALTEAGPDGAFGTPDDVTVPIKSLTAGPGASDVTLGLDAPLPQGYDRLRITGTMDPGGNVLDGDANGLAGGDFTRTFRTNSGAGGNVIGTPGPDMIRLRRDAAGTGVEVYVNVAPGGVPSYVLPLASLTTLNVSGGAGSDAFVIDLANGNFIPAGGINLDAGDGTADSLTVTGDGVLTGSYTPSATTVGSGVIVAGGGTINFTGLEPATVSGFDTFTVTTPNASDRITIDTPVAGQSRVSGTSGAAAITPLTFFNVGRMVLDLGTNDNVAPAAGAASPALLAAAAASPADDVVTIGDGGVGAAGLASLDAKAGIGANSVVANDGAVTLQPVALDAGGTVSLETTGDAVVNLRSGVHDLAALTIGNIAGVNLATGGATTLRTGAVAITGPAASTSVTTTCASSVRRCRPSRRC